jgi:hypothetical protein
MHGVRLAMNRPRTVRSLPQVRRTRFSAGTAPRATPPFRFWERESQLIGTHEHLTHAFLIARKEQGASTN